MNYKETAIFVVPKTPDQNFILAQESLKNFKVVNPNSLNVLDLIKNDKV